MKTFADILIGWGTKTAPSATTFRMSRKAIQYVTSAMGGEDWQTLPLMPLENAIVALDAAMAKANLGSQSRSNYRGYVRRLYRFAADEGIDCGSETNGRFWSSAPTDNGMPRRDQIAYGRFVRWAIGQGIWPATVRPDHVLTWAFHEQKARNIHWRQDYARLESTWAYLSKTDGMPKLTFPPLPAPQNAVYSLPINRWPDHLRVEWQKLCREAAAPLRKGGVRPWRATTRRNNEMKLTQFLGWLILENSTVDLANESWASLLSPTRCCDYINWLVIKSGKEYVNPGHAGFLRTIRGFHRNLLGSPQEVINGFHELTKRCEVHERDKAARMAPFAELERGLRSMLEKVASASRSWRADNAVRLASLQIDTIILGILMTRALRSSNLCEMRIGRNLIAVDDGYILKFTAAEMKGHRSFETTIPAELVTVMQDYLHRGYAALAGHAPSDGEPVFITRSGTPFNKGTLHVRVQRLTRKYVGRALNPHIFRHIVATHAAQTLKLTPTELAAFLCHRSPMTVMRFYEVTNPTRAATRFDQFRKGGEAS